MYFCGNEALYILKKEIKNFSLMHCLYIKHLKTSRNIQVQEASLITSLVTLDCSETAPCTYKTQ